MKFFPGFLLLSLLMFGCTEKQETVDKTAAQKAADASADELRSQGEQLFRANCASCHPRGGRGDYLKRIPATLLVKKSNYELKAWIQGVGQHRQMTSFSKLTEEELTALVAFLNAEIAK